jgi:hypothetical protein
MNATLTTESNDLRHGITVISGNTRTKIKIRLNDECKNGREDFAITADVAERDGGLWRESMGGCCHDHILSIRPDLAPFVALHLSDKDGCPMHGVDNAFYWFAGFNDIGEKYHGGSGSFGKSVDECRRIFAEYIRATPEQVSGIVAANPRTKEELQAVLEDAGFPEQWQREAQAAIAQLEEWTGKTFVSKATKAGFQPLSDEVRAVIAERRASGYYDPEQVAACDEAARITRKEKRIAEVKKDHEKALSKLNNKTAVALLLAEHFDGDSNVIYYDHTGQLQFNWSSINKLHTLDEFNAFVAWSADKLPSGLVCRWQEKPSR